MLGRRPTEADFGLFGSMFRHFFSDPTPAKIMREVAPRTLLWVARLWALTPSDFTAAPEVHSVPESCGPLLRLVADTHLPYLNANAGALAVGARTVRFVDYGATFETPVSPYRAWCLDELRAAFATLNVAGQKSVTDLLGPKSTDVLRQARRPVSIQVPVLPISSRQNEKTRDRNWV